MGTGRIEELSIGKLSVDELVVKGREGSDRDNPTLAATGGLADGAVEYHLGTRISDYIEEDNWETYIERC
jgi:hypothetical protein